LVWAPSSETTEQPYFLSRFLTSWRLIGFTKQL
jgi:hypothetical protein